MSLTVQEIPLGPISANCYVLTDTATQTCAVIDPGGFDEALIRLIGGRKVAYILLTHGHFDHIMGVYALQKATGARVAIHREDAPCLVHEEKSLCAWEYPGEQQPVHPDVLFADGDEIHIGESTLHVLHTPGHTKGGVCYMDAQARTIFSGDTLFCLTAGRTDFPGSSTEQLFESLQKLKNLNGDYTVYPGHNRATTLDFERTHNRYMRKM